MPITLKFERETRLTPPFSLISHLGEGLRVRIPSSPPFSFRLSSMKAEIAVERGRSTVAASSDRWPTGNESTY
jgi:hypothetical protein